MEKPCQYTVQQTKFQNDNPNMKKVVGDSLGGSLAFEFQMNHPDLQSRADSAPVVDAAFRPNANTERCRKFGDPISAFDSSAHTTMHVKFDDQRS